MRREGLVRPFAGANRERLLQAFPFICAAVFSTVLSYLAVLRYDAFTDAWDFGGFVQSLSNATQGGFFLQTIDAYFAKGFPQTEVISFMGLHFSPILYLLVPIYALFPYPPTLLVIQAIALSLGVFPVFWLARRELGDAASIAFSIVYLIYAPLIGIALNDFHPEAFLVPTLMFAIYFGLDKRWTLAAPFFLLALLVIEESGILVFGVVMFLLVYHRAWRNRRFLFASILAMAGALAYSAIASQLVYYFGLDPTGFTLTLNSENYSILGATAALGVPAAILRSPGSIVDALAYQIQYKLSFLVDLLAPVGLLPIFYPEAFLMALPWLSIAFLSNYAGYYEIYGFHQAFVLFFVFPAAIIGLKRIKLRSPRISPRLLKGYLAVMLVVAVAFSATQSLPQSVYGTTFSPSQQNLIEDQMLGLIPPNASLLTTSDIFPHVADRIDVYTVPPSALRSGYLQVDDEILSHIQVQYILLNVGSQDGQITSETDAILASKVFNGSYGLLGYSDKIMLLEQGYRGQPLIYDNPAVYNATNLTFDSRYTTAEPNGTLCHAAGTNWNNVWFGPYTFLPPGNYTAEFTIRTGSQLSSGATVMRIDVVGNNLTELARQILTGSSFPDRGWQTFDLNFQLKNPTFEMQFRGVLPTNATSICLENVRVVVQGQ